MSYYTSVSLSPLYTFTVLKLEGLKLGFVQRGSLEGREKTYGKLHHERVNDTANYSDEVKSVPRIFEIALNVKVNIRKAIRNSNVSAQPNQHKRQ